MKTLLLYSFIIISATLFGQNQRSKPANCAAKNGQIQHNYSVGKLNSYHSLSAHQKPPQNKTTKTSAISATRFTGSGNIFGVLDPGQKPLGYEEGVNAVSFIHRKSVTYTASTNSNSGTIVGMFSTNSGTSWDSTCLWANSNYLARYPQGGIFNPSGNTNINNAFIVGCGPFLNSGGSMIGNWYASKPLSGGGNNVAGSDQQGVLNATATASLNVHHWSNYGFSITDDGKVHSLGRILNDPTSTNLATYGLRGAALVKGMFSAGAFVWIMDSIIPATMTRTVNGTKYLNDWPLQTWSEDGQTGYVVFLGVRSNAAIPNRSYQPIVYKTTNSGAAWVLLPAMDCTNSKVITDRLWSVNTFPNPKIPYFSNREGWDATVDINSQLHIACTIVSAYTLNNDSLDYIYSFGPEEYDYGFTGPFDYPVIYNFTSTSPGSWNYHIVDSMGTLGLFSAPSYSANPWTNGMSTKPEYNARIQMSRSADGSKIFWSWTETDTTLALSKWNVYPDIVLRGYDVTTNMHTNRLGNQSLTAPSYTNVSTGVSNIDGTAYWHYMSPKAISTSTNGPWEIPLTVTNNYSLDGSVPVDHYYIKGAMVTQPNFTVSPILQLSGGCPLTSVSISKKNPSATLEIFPNPAHDKLQLSFSGEIKDDFHIKIYDVSGRKVLEKTCIEWQKTSQTIDLSTFSNGLYFLELGGSSVSEVYKLLKQ